MWRTCCPAVGLATGPAAAGAYLGAASAVILLAPRGEGCGLSCSLALHPQQGLLHWHKHDLQGVVRMEFNVKALAAEYSMQGQEAIRHVQTSAYKLVACNMI